MIRFYHKLLNNSVQPSKTSWENELAKKVNLATVVSILYMFIATVFVYIMHYDAFFYECLFATILLFGVLVVNRKNVIMAIYAYYVYPYSTSRKKRNDQASCYFKCALFDYCDFHLDWL